MEGTLNAVASDSASHAYISPQVGTEGVQDIDLPFVVAKDCHPGAQKVKALDLLLGNVLTVRDSVPTVGEGWRIAHLGGLHVLVAALLEGLSRPMSSIHFQCFVSVLWLWTDRVKDGEFGAIRGLIKSVT